MRLIDQEDGSILFPGCFRVSEKAGETDPGVKDIIIIADNDIREIRCVKGQLIGAYTVLFSTVRDLLRRYWLSALRTVQQISERPIDPVIVAVCPGAAGRPAVHLIADTGALLRDKLQTADAQPPLIKQPKTLQRHPAGHIFGGEIKNLLRLPLSHCLQGRKKDSKRFPGPCRSLQKKLSAMDDRPVDSRRKVKLPLPIRKREVHSPDRSDG